MAGWKPKAGWLIWIVLVLLIAVLVWDKWQTYKWEHNFWRSYAHYYYCDSIHKDDAKCAALSNHVPPPPPPPQW
jgi:hypothetical protein